MAVIYIEDAANQVGGEVTIRGWLRSRRDKGKLHFLTIRDGTGDLQAVVSKSAIGDAQFELSSQLTQESSCAVTGRSASRRRGRPVDMNSMSRRSRSIQLAEPFPIQPKEHGTGFLMEHRHLWLRSSRQHAILRVRHEIIRACREFFDNEGSFWSMRRSSLPMPAKEPRRSFKLNILMRPHI